MGKNTQVIAVIADIIDSKKIKDRSLFQSILSESLTELNNYFSKSLLSHLTITLGDEFQGVFQDMEHALLMIDTLNLRLRMKSRELIGEEVQLRWGIGVGELTVPIQDPKRSLGSDGPAYWNAREALEDLKKKQDYGKTMERLIAQSTKDEYWNAQIRLQNAIRHQWTTTQAETSYVLLKSNEYKEIHNQNLKRSFKTLLGKDLSDQTISKRLASTNIKQYKDARKALANDIEEWRKNYVD